MSKKTLALSAVVGAAAALVTCLVFFFFVYQPASSNDIKPSPTPAKTPTTKPMSEIPNPEIKAENVKSISIDTVYKGYFAPGNKCAKTYNEYFGNEDGIGSSSSPCTLRITFDREGLATRSITISRWDKTAKQKREVEKSESTSSVSPEQYTALAEAITSNTAFKSWRDGMTVTVSNCSISAVHSGGTRTVMSNVDEKTTVYLEMIDAIKKLEAQLNWKDGQ